jgi:hypothetical protein
LIYVTLALLGFGIVDLVRWSPQKVGSWHAAVAAIAGVAAVAGVAELSGMEDSEVGLASVLGLVVFSLWSAYDLIESEHAKPAYPLVLVLGTILALLAISGSAEPVDGELGTWYANLDFGFARDIPVDQFILGVGAACFLLATGNRIVRYLLLATEARLLKSEGTLRGGRVLGPMERLIVAAAVVSGGIAGAGFVIAAKGLLRFREIQAPGRSGARQIRQPRVDEITEYFLIGTFASVVIAGIIAILVLASA